MVKVAKTARTFDAVREFVVGFLSFYFSLSLSLDMSRLDGLGLACRSAERSPPSLSLSLSRFVSNAKTVWSPRMSALIEKNIIVFDEHL